MKDKPLIAVLQFPGINSEYETQRALWDADMDAEFFRWNQDPRELDRFDGFVIPGGFSYEDRGRAGLIASMDPVMREIAQQAAKGKPVLGICNGAQILVETGLIPGGAPSASSQHPLLMCLARNKRMRDGKVLGVGFYNENVHLKSTAPRGRTAFTLNYDPDELAWAPVAHGEGRFTSRIPQMLDTLRGNEQIVFRYCDENGTVDPNFPVNPNGAMDNAAAICNPAGNVLAIMPHPERAFTASMLKIFESMRQYIEGAELVGTHPPLTLDAARPEPTAHTHTPNTLELYVQLIITDNEAQTIENALQQAGFDVKIRKWTHWEVAHDTGLDQAALAEQLIASGELLNTNKESAIVLSDGDAFPKKEGAHYLLVRDREDALGASKTAKIQHHLDAPIQSIRHGWFWEITGDVDREALLATNIFANHHAQELHLF